MSKKLNLTLRYAIQIEVLFFVVCAFLVAIEYFIGSGTFTVKGTLYAFAVFQVPAILLVAKHWSILSKDPFIN